MNESLQLRDSNDMVLTLAYEPITQQRTHLISDICLYIKL